MLRRALVLLLLTSLLAVPQVASAHLFGHHHHRYYYQAAPAYYAAPGYYSAPPAAVGSSPLLELLLPILLERVRNGGNDRIDAGSPSEVRKDLKKLQVDLAEFRKEQTGANESFGIMLQRQGQELASVRTDLETMKAKLDSVAASTGSSSTLQAAVAEMRARFPQRSKAEVRTTLLDELNKKIKAQSKLDASEQKALIDALTKDFDAQLDAAFPNWQE